MKRITAIVQGIISIRVSVEFEGMSNWFCNQAVLPGWRVRGMHPRMMGMTKPCLDQSESWNARLSTNQRAWFAAGRFPCVRSLWPVDPVVVTCSSVRYSPCELPHYTIPPILNHRCSCHTFIMLLYWTTIPSRHNHYTHRHIWRGKNDEIIVVILLAIWDVRTSV